MFERLLFGFVVSGVVDIVVVRIGNGEVLPRLRSDDFDGDTGFCFRPVRLAIEVPVSEIHGNIGVACFQGDRQGGSRTIDIKREAGFSGLCGKEGEIDG